MQSLIDTHAHIYADQFKDDLEETIARAKAVGISHICMPNIDVDSIEAMYRVEESYPGYCHSMMGLHPCSVKEDYETQLDLMEKELEKRKFIAIGELGLDYYWDKSYIPQQKAAMELQISWAKSLNLPIVIHSRDSLQDSIDIVRKHQDGTLTGVFHCFGESRELLDQIIDLGFFAGLGGVLTYKKDNLRNELKESDLDHLVLETDSPYLAPVPRRGKRNECSYLTYVMEVLAESLEMTDKEIAKRTTANAHRLYVGMD